MLVVCLTQCFFQLTKTKTITSKRNSIVLWHFCAFNSRRYELFMSVCFTRLCNSTHRKIRCVLALAILTSCVPAPLLPRGRPSASRAAKQTQRSSRFPRRIGLRFHADRCSRLTR